MSFKIYNAEVTDNCIRFGNIQILFLQGSLTSGSERRIDFPKPFLDKSYSITISGDYGSTLNIANKYKDSVFLNVAGNGAYNTGKYELIAIGKWK